MSMEYSKHKKESVEKFNFVVIGDKGTGRTTLLNLYTKGYPASIGFLNIEHFVKVCDKKTVCFSVFEVNVYTYDFIIDKIEESDGLIVFYDVSNPESFRRCEWYVRLGHSTLKVVIANKSDLVVHQVKYETGKEFSDDNKSLFFETNCKDKENIEEMFDVICDAVRLRKKKNKLKYSSCILL